MECKCCKLVLSDKEEKIGYCLVCHLGYCPECNKEEEE